MKFSFIIVLLSVIQSFAVEGYSQQARISMNKKNVQIRTVLNEIEKSTEFYFMYSGSLIDVQKTVDVDVDNATIDEVLSKIFSQTGISYIISDRQIALSRSLPTLQTEQKGSVVSGRVSDENGDPLPGVSVMEKGTTNGTITDFDGKYTLNNVNDNAVLTFSFMGMETAEVPFTGQKTLDVVLKMSTFTLNEVVAIGYGVQKKVDITGSVSVVGDESFQSRPNTQFATALQGQAAGVKVLSTSGKPSEGLSIRIRGVNSIAGGSDPLFVWDGVPTTDIKYLNPGDIENISILKDASSAAIYGASGANGVVLITTKSGAAGKTKVEFNAYTGFSQISKKIDVLNAAQYKELMTEMGYVTNWANYTADTDWQDQVYQNGSSQNYQISFAGNSDNTKFYVSGGWVKQNGAVRSSTMDRYNFKANLSKQVYSWLNFGTNFAYTRWHDVDVTDNNNVSRGGVILGALTTPPVLNIYNANGTFTSNPFQDWENPIASTDGSQRGYNNQRVLGNIYGEVSIIDGLKFKSNLGIDYVNGKFDSFLDPFRTNYGRAKKGIGVSSSNLTNYWMSENTLSYAKVFGRHDISAVVGTVAQKRTWESTYLEVIGYSSTNIPTVNAGSTIVAASGSKSEKTNASFISRLAYKFDDKYLFTANFRSDASSSFGPGNRWGYFPSFSLGWRISQEDFFKSIEQINDLKLRLGWGQVGNDQIGTYAWVGGINSGANYTFGGVIQPGIYPSSIENKDLHWEKTQQTNIGLDLAMLDSRIVFTADAYIKNTSDLLMWKTIPYATGFESALQNIGKVQNRGLEFQLTSHNLEGSELKWTTNFNISFNRNEVIDTNGQDIIGSDVGGRGNLSFSEEGSPLGLFKGYVAEGVDPQTGMMKYKDLNNDGVIDADHDRQIIGDPNPDFIWGLTNTLSWKGLTFNLFIEGTQGNDIYNASRMETEGLYYPNNQTTEVLRRWKVAGQVTDIPKAMPNNTENTRLSTRFVEDGSYVRIKSLTLSYDLPKDLLRRVSVSGLKVYFTGENMLTLTSYKGYDPEVNSFGADNINQGIDYGTYPQTKNYIFGIIASF